MPTSPEEHAFPFDKEPGLSVRDYFAAAALSGICATLQSGGNTYTHEQAARHAYTYADAMMERRLLAA